MYCRECGYECEEPVCTKCGTPTREGPINIVCARSKCPGCGSRLAIALGSKHPDRECRDCGTKWQAPHLVPDEPVEEVCDHPPRAWKRCERCRDVVGDLRFHEDR